MSSMHPRGSWENGGRSTDNCLLACSNHLKMYSVHMSFKRCYFSVVYKKIRLCCIHKIHTINFWLLKKYLTISEACFSCYHDVSQMAVLQSTVYFRMTCISIPLSAWAMYWDTIVSQVNTWFPAFRAHGKRLSLCCCCSRLESKS